MKIYVDENIPRITVVQLRENGHIVNDMRETEDKGASDEKLWELCQKDKALLITTDMGFSTNRYEQHFGILIIRLKKPNKSKIHQRVMNAIERIKPDEWPGLLIIAQEKIQRIWKE